MTRVILLSGQIGVGKTTIANALAARIGARLLGARNLLLQMAGAEETRASLQAIGLAVDKRTNGRWLAHALEEQIDRTDSLFVVDAVRTVRQTVPVLDRIDGSVLVYLEASESQRRQRYHESARVDLIKARSGFDASQSHETERKVPELRALAHLIVDSEELSAAATCQVVVDALGLSPLPN